MYVYATTENKGVEVATVLCYTLEQSRTFMRKGQNMNWNTFTENSISEYISAVDFNVSSYYSTDFLDVSETISELSYLTHDYFRYYGKFPSKVAKHIIETMVEEKVITPATDFVFDNYNGSGTTMVEAKIAGFSSGGIDINPFGVLAANVKTFNYDVGKLQTLFNAITQKLDSVFCEEPQQTLFSSDTHENTTDISDIDQVCRQVYIDFPDIEKWFDKDVIYQLSAIKHIVLQLPRDEYREFFALVFFAIIRRVSKAHDAEVRPHVNPKKRKRNAIEAFTKKAGEMIATMGSWNTVTSDTVESHTYICDNSDAVNVANTLNRLRNRYKKDLGLVISHPPYLNCFDYIPVYRLKFLWAFGFDEIYGDLNYQQIKGEELKSYPASTDRLVNNYFQHNYDAYKAIYDNLKSGGYCCVVIGDCTINTQLFSVHKMIIKMMEAIGFTCEKVTYRSTSYGLGRYAYKHKADYNDKEGGKKDAILFFKKA